MWDELTILWNDLTIDWNDLTWNDLTMERNDRIPKMPINYPGIKLKPALRTRQNCHHMLTSSTQLQERSFHVIERTRTSSKCQKMKNARAKRAKILFIIVKYANLWGLCCRRRRG